MASLSFPDLLSSFSTPFQCLLFFPDCTWPQLRTSFPSLSVQARGWGMLTPSLCSSVPAHIGPHGPTPPLVLLSPVALSHALYLFL